MTQRLFYIIFTAVLTFSSSTALFAEGASNFGLGVNYFTAIDDLSSDIDKDGFSYFISYQYRPGLIGFEANFEVLPDIYNVDAITPSAYLIVGKTLYAAVGMGIMQYDGHWANDPYYGLKLGLNLSLTESIILDVFGKYQISSKVDIDNAIDNIDTDTIYLGGAVRFRF